MLKTRTTLGETFADEPIVGTRRDGEAVRLADGHPEADVNRPDQFEVGVTT